MQKVIVTEFVTLDGVMQAPGRSDEDRCGGFEHGGWQRQYGDVVEGAFIVNGIAESGGFLLGRRTYDIFAGYWPKRPAEDKLALLMNSLPKWIVSTSLKEPLAWENSTLIKGSVAQEVAKLKQQNGKNILVIGSGDLVQTLMKHDLIDEYRLMVHPLVLGSGKRLFRDDSPKVSLRLTDTKRTGTGIMILIYEPERRGNP